MSAGVDHLDFDELPEGITVASNAGAYAEPVAEHVLALALALARGLREEHDNLREGQFNQRREHRSLRESTLGIVGYGGIGREVARLFEPFDVEVMGINSSGRDGGRLDWCGTLEDLPELSAASDVLVVSIPLKQNTRGLIGGDELRAMKDDAILINVARGEIVDAQALYEHLSDHPDFKAGLGAWWREPFRDGEFETSDPFLELPNVIGCPHNSAVVPGALETGLRRAAENLRRELRWDEPEGVIDRDEYTDL
jgi:glycerate dehydrogenase